MTLEFAVIYSNDIFIFSKNSKKHEKHTQLVFNKLWEKKIYARLEKCVFHQLHVNFLGYIISNNGLSMDLKKIQTIINWKT